MVNDKFLKILNKKNVTVNLDNGLMIFKAASVPLCTLIGGKAIIRRIIEKWF